MKSSDRPKFGNLQNLKVLNAGAVIAAPFVCELFAEQGADVIELESTVAPDMYRMYGDAWSVDRRNQRMMTLNIPSPEGKEILLQMVKWADVLVESSKGGTWEKWGPHRRSAVGAEPGARHPAHLRLRQLGAIPPTCARLRSTPSGRLSRATRTSTASRGARPT